MSWTAPRTWNAGEIITAAIMNTHVRDNIEELDPTDGWTALTLQNGWVNYGGGWATAAYRKAAGIVYVRGLIRDGSTPAGTTITTLPVGYRPADTLMAFVNNGPGSLIGRNDYYADGTIRTAHTASAHTNLEFCFPI